MTLLLAVPNAAYGELEEYITPQQYTANKIADLKRSGGGNLQSQLALGSIYADNSAGELSTAESAKWYERAFFNGSLDQLIGRRGDKVGAMQMWWHITTYTKILQRRPDPDYAFKLEYMNALLACNDENGANYYQALQHANLAQSYNRNPAYTQRAQKLYNSLLTKIRQEQRAKTLGRR